MPVNKEDFELLSLAALAAGYSFDKNTLKNDRTGFEYAGWNPLEDDGDAFRLAVRLSIPFHVFYGQNTVIAYGKKTKHFPEGKDEILSFTDNPNESTRRAIVRAAAEIGKVMK